MATARGCLYKSCKVLEQRWNGVEIAQRVSSMRESVTSYETNICLLLVCVLQGPRASTQKGKVLHTLLFVWIKGTEKQSWHSCLYEPWYLELTTGSYALAASASFSIFWKSDVWRHEKELFFFMQIVAYLLSFIYLVTLLAIMFLQFADSIK